MKLKLIFTFLIFTLIVPQVFALDVVYPRKNQVTINSASTFFIGSSKVGVPLTVNGEYVRVHPSGGFAYVVNLRDGKNTFVLQSGDEIKTFIIEKPARRLSSGKYTPPPLVEYTSKKNYYISSDGAPLRGTPVDSGINRLSHFEKDVPLLIDGEKSNFYRVVLNNNEKAWIAKTNVKAFEGYLNPPAVVSGRTFTEDDKYYTFTFSLDKKTPYVMTEGQLFTLKFYNVKDYPDNTYVFTFPIHGKLYGYQGAYDGNKFILKIRKFPEINPDKPLKGRVITIDAGHGGHEIGSIGCCGHKEKDITLAIAQKLEKELQSRGATVFMTRRIDNDVSLKARVDYANSKDSEMLISIHANALPDGADPNKHSGTSIFYYYNQSKPLADKIITEMTTQAGTNNDKVRQGSLALVRNTNALSILIEVAYMINPEDNAKLIDTAFQQQCAKSIADGIEKYFTTDTVLPGNIN